MKFIMFLVAAAVVLSQMIDSYAIAETPKDEADSWSKPTNGLRVRITLVEKTKNGGPRTMIPYLELENVGDSASPMKIRCGGDNVAFELVDADGKVVRDGYGLPRGGVHVGPGTVLLPHDSSMRIWMHCNNWGAPRNVAAIVATDSGAWVLERQEKGKLFLRARLSGTKVEDPADQNYWSGTITTPPVKLDWKE